MSQASQLSPELARGLQQLARALLEEPLLANTWERDSSSEYPRAVIEGVDPDSVSIDPLKYM